MSRKSFIQSQGATCANWTWSWSFVNVEKQMVIFGVWDKNTEGSRSLILSEAWATNRAGRKNPAYPQSREHIRLVEEQGYKLLTFPIIFSDELQDEDGLGPARIKGFEPVLTQKSLVRFGGSWYASDDAVPTSIAEEVSSPERFVEGLRRQLQSMPMSVTARPDRPASNIMELCAPSAISTLKPRMARLARVSFMCIT
jgi:5-methylcytosine-specific restriction protein A